MSYSNPFTNANENLEKLLVKRIERCAKQMSKDNCRQCAKRGA